MSMLYIAQCEMIEETDFVLADSDDAAMAILATMATYIDLEAVPTFEEKIAILRDGLTTDAPHERLSIVKLYWQATQQIFTPKVTESQLRLGVKLGVCGELYFRAADGMMAEKEEQA